MTPAIFGLSGLELTDSERDFFMDADPVGYILFARNCETQDQLRALTDSLRAIHGRDQLLISIDQEGGRVVRMKPPEWTRYPAGEAFDQLFQLAPASAIEAVRANAQAMGQELRRAGITVNYHAPFDVRRPETDRAIGDRALGSDPVQVAALGRALLEGLAAAGVAGCLKHMPGHGRATADSHKELPVVDVSDAELEADIAPFRALADAPIGMSAHIRFTAWDAANPATQSAHVIQHVIRERIGFDGLLLTDDIDMEALDGTIAQRSERAIAAGCDVVLNCWAKMGDMQAIASILPALSSIGSDRLGRALAVTAHAGSKADDPAVQRAMLDKRDALLALSRAA